MTRKHQSLKCAIVMKVFLFFAATWSFCTATEYRHVNSQKQAYPGTYTSDYQYARPTYSDFGYRVRDDYIAKHGGISTLDARGYNNANNNYRPSYSGSYSPDYLNEYKATPYNPENYSPDYKNDYTYVPAHSDFSYRVNKGDYSKRGQTSTSGYGSHGYNSDGYSSGPLDFGHSEKKSGDKTAGSYDVVLPDGRRQIVTYYVDGSSGFVANVRYEPAYKSTVEPTYRTTTLAPSYKQV